MKLTKVSLALGSGLLLASCGNAKDEQVMGSKPITGDAYFVTSTSKLESPALKFLRSKRYKYVARVAAIPTAALAAIENNSLLCDTSSGIPINLSDVHIGTVGGGDNKECTKKLNFALVGNTYCLIAYRQGGIGVHDVVYFIRYRGKYSFTKETGYSIDDTLKLARFLSEQLVAERGYSDKIAPPPPWPVKTAK